MVEITRSLGGSISSGLGTLILMKIPDDFPDRIATTCSLFPSKKVPDVVVDPYDTTLSVHELLENADFRLVIDNPALYNISTKVLQNPKYKELVCDD